MPDALLAVLPYYLCAIGFLGGAGEILIHVTYRALPLRYMGVFAAGVLLSCVFTLLAISAGPLPIIHRADIVIVVRWLCLLTGLSLLGCLVLSLRAAVRAHPAPHT